MKALSLLALVVLPSCYTAEQLGLVTPAKWATREAVQQACQRAPADRFGAWGESVLAPQIGYGIASADKWDTTKMWMVWPISSPDVALSFLWQGRDWSFFEIVEADQGIGMLPAKVTDRDAGPHLVSESIDAQISLTKLRECSSTGITFRLRGNRGSREVPLPPHFVQGFLAACDAAKVGQ
jgi:hypothetical protein